MGCFGCCIPMLIPISCFAFANWVYDDPEKHSSIKIKFFALGVLFIATWISSKVRCEPTDKQLFLRSLAPASIFLIPIIIEFIPFFFIRTIFEQIDGTILVILLTLVYKLIYDSILEC